MLFFVLNGYLYGPLIWSQTKLNGKNELLIVVGVFSTIVFLFARESQIYFTDRDTPLGPCPRTSF